MAAFVPPLFGNLGKAASDLFKKKYDFQNVIQQKHKTKSGLVFTSGAELGNGITGSLKLNYKQSSGEAEGEIHTNGNGKGVLKFNKLADGAVVHVSADAKNKDWGNTSTGKALVDYQQDFFSGSASVETSFFDRTQLVGSGVIGFDGLSVGGEVKFDVKHVNDVDDYNVGAEYTQPDYTATIKTAKRGEDITASYFHKISADHQVGAQFLARISGGDEKVLTLGTEYKVDESTALKVKGDTKGDFAGVLQHDLKNPSVRFALSSLFDARSPSALTAKKFGLGITFGDYDA
jgi:hypothetical protein